MLHRQNNYNLSTKIDQIFYQIKSLTIFNFINMVLPVITGIFVNAIHAVIRKITESYKKEKEENPCGNSSWVNSCARRDSNPHVSRH